MCARVACPTWSRGPSTSPLDVPAMHFDVGPYRLTLPPTAQLPHASERAPPHRVVPDFRIGPFAINALLSDGSLKDWRDHVDWETKYQTTVSPVEANGIPGLTLVPSSQRLDYAFQSPGRQRVDIVAWSDTPTSSEQQQIVQAAVLTIHVPQPTVLVAGPSNNRWRGP